MSFDEEARIARQRHSDRHISPKRRLTGALLPDAVVPGVLLDQVKRFSAFSAHQELESDAT